MENDEQVMVIPRDNMVEEAGDFRGAQIWSGTGVDKHILKMFRNAQYRPRKEVETDSTWKQTIPYVIFRWFDAAGVPYLFQYTRTKQQGEARLHGLRSLGIGGHINPVDSLSLDGATPWEAYTAGMHREVTEELHTGESGVGKLTFVGLLNDESNEVGKVHLGLLHIWDIECPILKPLEGNMDFAGLEPLPQLRRNIDKFETWSQICLRDLAVALTRR